MVIWACDNNCYYSLASLLVLCRISNVYLSFRGCALLELLLVWHKPSNLHSGANNVKQGNPSSFIRPSVLIKLCIWFHPYSLFHYYIKPSSASVTLARSAGVYQVTFYIHSGFNIWNVHIFQFFLFITHGIVVRYIFHVKPAVVLFSLLFKFNF